MNNLLIAVAVGALFLIGCSRSGGIPESKKLRNAPTEESHTGYLVLNAQESILAELAEDNAHVYVRPINTRHGLYEVHGTTGEFLQESLGPYAIVHRNKYMVQRKRESENIENCFDVTLSNDLDKYEVSYIYELGETVSVEITSEQGLGSQYMLEPPAGSSLTNIFGADQNFKFTPDISGEYVLFIGSTEVDTKACPAQRKSIYITGNPKLNSHSRLSKREKEKTDLNGFWQIAALGLKEAWKKSTGKGTVIAIIDTGVNYNHEALNENIYINENEIPENGIDDDNNGYVDDYHGYDMASSDPYPFDDQGHGSHVAGLAAATTYGVAKEAKILAIKTQAGMGLDIGTFAGAILYAVDQGADVINASFAWKKDYPIFRAAVEYANKKGVFIMAAAGNGDRLGNGMDNDLYPSYPTNYEMENVISVAAISRDGSLTSYSNFGRTSVDIATVGGDYSSSLLSASHRGPNPNVKYVQKSGTSMATPIMAGAMALAISKYPKASPAALRELLMNSATNTPALSGRLLSGGTLNLSRLLSSLP